MLLRLSSQKGGDSVIEFNKCPHCYLLTHSDYDDTTTTNNGLEGENIALPSDYVITTMAGPYISNQLDLIYGEVTFTLAKIIASVLY